MARYHNRARVYLKSRLNIVSYILVLPITNIGIVPLMIFFGWWESYFTKNQFLDEFYHDIIGYQVWHRKFLFITLQLRTRNSLNQFLWFIRYYIKYLPVFCHSFLICGSRCILSRVVKKFLVVIWFCTGGVGTLGVVADLFLLLDVIIASSGARGVKVVVNVELLFSGIGWFIMGYWKLFSCVVQGT